MNLCNLLIITIISLFIASPVNAAPPETWYEINMIIFSRTSSSAANAEHWPANPGYPNMHGALALHSGIGGSTRQKLADGSVAYQVISPKEKTLEQEYRKLQSANGISPKLHLIWKQPIRAKKNTKLLSFTNKNRIRSNASFSSNPPNEIEATIRVSKKRYLHLDLDLAFNRPAPLDNQMAFSDVTNTPPKGTGVQTIRLQTSRRMRSGDLHYIDHPMFGALVKITRIKTDVTETKKIEAPVKAVTELPK